MKTKCTYTVKAQYIILFLVLVLVLVSRTRYPFDLINLNSMTVVIVRSTNHIWVTLLTSNIVPFLQELLSQTPSRKKRVSTNGKKVPDRS